MAKKNVFRVTGCLLMLAACLAGLGMAQRPTALTLLVVPVRYSVLQVVFDVAARYPAILVSYQGDATTEEPLLHAWNGREWVYISREDYRTGRFLQNRPPRTILIGEEKDLPEVLITDSEWCPMVMSIPAIDTATLVNSFGKVFSFSERDWQWFAHRYNLGIVDMNEDARTKSWYDQPFVERLPPPEYEYQAPPERLYIEEERDDTRIIMPPPAPQEPPISESVTPMESDVEEAVPPVAAGVDEVRPLPPPEPEPIAESLPPPSRSRRRRMPDPEGWQERAVATE